MYIAEMGNLISSLIETEWDVVLAHHIIHMTEEKTCSIFSLLIKMYTYIIPLIGILTISIVKLLL